MYVGLFGPKTLNEQATPSVVCKIFLSLISAIVGSKILRTCAENTLQKWQLLKNIRFF
jgi:hypothetical protein